MGKSENKRFFAKLSMLSAWAFAFGCAVGWDAFILPVTVFLPKAGPLGTLIGILAGGLVMAVIAWNYHVMMNRHPGSGGAYTFASEAFGRSHGFVCAWYLCLAYMAIVWMDATILATIAYYIAGDVFRFGFCYTIYNQNIYFGNMLLSGVAVAIAAAICLKRRTSNMAQTAFALVFALGIVVCFAVAIPAHSGGLQSLGPAFRQDGTNGLSQILRLLALAPWFFIGFETISNLSGEFGFPVKKSFAVMASALVSAVVAYLMLAAIPVLAPPEGFANWSDAILVTGEWGFAWFDALKHMLGKAGLAVIGVSLTCAIFTNLVGNTVAASRLLAAMAEDGMLPTWFARTNRDDVPRNAIIAIAAVSVGISALGQAMIGVIVDVAVIGAVIAYMYTSAATLRTAVRTRSRFSVFTAIVGLVAAIVLSLLFILPNVTSETSLMTTESYLAVVLWSIVGLLIFLSVFRKERQSMAGSTSLVWVFMLGIVLFMSVMWIRETTYDTTRQAFNDIVQHHRDLCMQNGNGHSHEGAGPVDFDWQGSLLHKLSYVNRSIVRNSVVQLGLTILAFALTFALYATLRRREREMEREKARAKSYFFSTVSHDIRTPLNAIIGFSEMLRAGMDTKEEKDQALDAIVVSGKTLLGLVNDVLDLSKLESGKMEINPEPTDCPRLVREIMDAFRVSTHKPHLELRCRTDEMPSLMLDPQRVRQIVFNLVGNAVKFTETGHVELRAIFERNGTGGAGELRIEVEDTGCGISDADKKHVGSAYVQVGSKASRNGGTGLGLAICSQLATAMGGKLRFKSVLGEGTTFSVIVPDVKIATNEDCRKASAAKTAETVHEQRTIFRTRRMLIVDDSNMNIMVLKAFLKHLGNFNVVSAVDGQDALQILKDKNTEPFDLILTDMWMPNLDGKGLLDAIRANERYANIHVIAVTADVELQTKAAEMGFDDVLLKPITCEKLRQALVREEKKRMLAATGA